jgi:hypothetical protein
MACAIATKTAAEARITPIVSRLLEPSGTLVILPDLSTGWRAVCTLIPSESLFIPITARDRVSQLASARARDLVVMTHFNIHVVGKKKLRIFEPPP